VQKYANGGFALTDIDETAQDHQFRSWATCNRRPKSHQIMQRYGYIFRLHSVAYDVKAGRTPGPGQLIVLSVPAWGTTNVLWLSEHKRKGAQFPFFSTFPSRCRGIFTNKRIGTRLRPLTKGLNRGVLFSEKEVAWVDAFP
jgi:hypothetical protein